MTMKRDYTYRKVMRELIYAREDFKSFILFTYHKIQY